MQTQQLWHRTSSAIRGDWKKCVYSECQARASIMPQNYTVPPVIFHLHKLPLEAGCLWLMQTEWNRVMAPCIHALCSVDIIGPTINVFIYKEISTYRKGSWKKIWWWSSSFSVGKLTSSWSRLKRNREHTNHLFYDSLKSDCLSVCLSPASQQLPIGCWKEK